MITYYLVAYYQHALNLGYPIGRVLPFEKNNSGKV